MATRPTIENLEGKVWPAPEFQSSLVLATHALRKKPLEDLTPNDLRIVFNQDIGTEYVKERVLAVLETEPDAGELYAGDLIVAVLRSKRYQEDREFREKIGILADTAIAAIEDIDTRNEIGTLKDA
jgi:CDI immunity proteins